MEDGTGPFQMWGAVVYQVNETIRFPPNHGYRFDTGAITLNINTGSQPGVVIDSCMMVDLAIRGQLVYHGSGVALDFNPTNLLPPDTFVGDVIVDSSFHITTVVPTSTSATAIRFNGPVVHSTFFFNEINAGNRGIDVTGNFALNRLMCKHLHAQAGANSYGVRVTGGGFGKNYWELNINADTGLGMTTGVETSASNDFWMLNIGRSNGSISTGVRLNSSVRNTRFFILSNDANTPVVDNANSASNSFY